MTCSKANTQVHLVFSHNVLRKNEGWGVKKYSNLCDVINEWSFSKICMNSFYPLASKESRELFFYCECYSLSIETLGPLEGMTV